MLGRALPDYPIKYRVMWQVAVVCLIVSTGFYVFFEVCYSHAAGSAAFQGVPWAASTQGDRVANKHWGSGACNASFDVYDPAFVDAVLIGLPANVLMLTSLISQTCIKRNPKKLPEVMLIGLLLSFLSGACIMKSTDIKMQLRKDSYPATNPLYPSLFFGLAIITNLTTVSAVWLGWPRGAGDEDDDSNSSLSNEEEPLEMMDVSDLPLIVRPLERRSESGRSLADEPPVHDDNDSDDHGDGDDENAIDNQEERHSGGERIRQRPEVDTDAPL